MIFISRDEWDAKKRHGYTIDTEAGRKVLTMTDRGTGSVPVIITDTTEDYPVRHVAFKEARIFWEYTNKDGRAGELAVYNEPMVNTHFPDLVDGIYATIFDSPYGGVLIDFYATRPDRHREGTGIWRPMKSYEEAKERFLEWYPQAYAFCHTGRHHFVQNGVTYTVSALTKDGVSREQAVIHARTLARMGYETILRQILGSLDYRVYARKRT